MKCAVSGCRESRMLTSMFCTEHFVEQMAVEVVTGRRVRLIDTSPVEAPPADAGLAIVIADTIMWMVAVLVAILWLAGAN